MITERKRFGTVRIWRGAPESVCEYAGAQP